jgi:hypothetical protein
LIVDAFGKIPGILKSCHTAVVGGSFAPYGGHNLWEPLTAGVAMTIGPYYGNQAYLVARLKAANLLNVSKGVLSPESLQKPPASPGPSCRSFIDSESYSLQQATREIEKQFQKRLRTSDLTRT